MAQRLYISNKDDVPGLFQHRIIERLISPRHWEPFVIFIPVFLFFFYRSVFVLELGLWTIMGMWLLATVFWTLTEYVIHRFVYHFEPKSETMKKVMYALHGAHHDYPNDLKKLVVPPILSIPNAILIYFLFSLILGPINVVPFFTGLIFTYIIYDLNHYACHHLNWKNPVFQIMKKHHLRHHYMDPEKCFGFTTTLWDKLFKTDLKPPKENP